MQNPGMGLGEPFIPFIPMDNVAGLASRPVFLGLSGTEDAQQQFCEMKLTAICNFF